MTLTNSFEKLFGRTKGKQRPNRYFKDKVIKKKESGITIRKDKDNEINGMEQEAQKQTQAKCGNLFY